MRIYKDVLAKDEEREKERKKAINAHEVATILE